MNDIEKAIETLKMENELMQFDPNTGEDYPIELQNQDNQDLYKANLIAISALEKLAEYEGLEEQGLLIKLPCKLGTKVYVVDNDFDGCTLKIYETSYNLGLYEYGAKIFLTREEAEKALLEVKE